MLVLDPDFLEKFGVIDWSYIDSTKPLSFTEYEDWIQEGLHGPLQYLADERKDKRAALDPHIQSMLIFLFDYTSARKALSELSPLRNIASYVFGFEGKDYHYILKERLDLIAGTLNLSDYKIALDTSPVLERDFATQAGLGWIGKNSMHISRKHGSFHLIGSLLLSKKLEFPLKEQETDHCGQCTRCLDACPTQAILPNRRTIDASLCISTFTIEQFGDEKQAPKGLDKTNWIYGCDICQDVCPWNQKPLAQAEKQAIDQSLLDFFQQDRVELLNLLKQMSNREYQRKFKYTPFERTGRKAMIKNLLSIKD